MTLQTKIAEEALDTFEDLIKDPSRGLNVVLPAVCQEYGIKPIQFDFGINSHSYWRANLSPTDLEESSISKYPYLMVYTLSEQDQGIRKFQMFSGYVAIAWDAWISWKNVGAQRDMEKPGAAVSASMFRVLFDESTTWGAIAPKKSMTVKRGRIAMAGESWIQGIHGALVIEMDAN